jgi:uncharacterized protein
MTPTLNFEQGRKMSVDMERWERACKEFLRSSAGADAAHDESHIQRVARSARALAAQEGADLAVVLPAAWLHDCVVVPKDSPLRASASALAARAAVDFLRAQGYPEELLAGIHHAIEAHSFSAGIAPRTRDAEVVQDADRLDALGAIGIARCFVTAGAMGRRLYDPAEPFPERRAPDDRANTIDHFYAKLLLLEGQMRTAAGRAEAQRRTAFMRQYLAQLAHELGS